MRAEARPGMDMAGENVALVAPYRMMCHREWRLDERASHALDVELLRRIAGTGIVIPSTENHLDR